MYIFCLHFNNFLKIVSKSYFISLNITNLKGNEYNFWWFIVLTVLMCVFKTISVLIQIGASFHLTNVQVYMVDLKKVRPLGSTSIEAPSSPFTPNQSIRKSFSKAERPVSLKNRSLNVKTIEESTSGTDPEEESIADITNLNDYEEIFKGKGRKYRRQISGLKQETVD